VMRYFESELLSRCSICRLRNVMMEKIATLHKALQGSRTNSWSHSLSDIRI